MLNYQRYESIDFATATFNPITGCLGHNNKHCSYCYLKRLSQQYQNDFMTPKFHPDRLDDIDRSRKLKTGDRIFVGSAGDTYGSWVESKNIIQILEVTKKHKELIFIMMTKNPKRYSEFEMPMNVWQGVSIDGPAGSNRDRALDFINACKDNNNLKFICFEPLLAPVKTKFENMKISWIIIGGNSNEGAEKPPDKWADDLIAAARIKKIPVWMKNNYSYHTVLKEIPKPTIIEQAVTLFGGKVVNNEKN